MLLIDDLSVRVAGRLLIDHASIQIPSGARVGLVGRNGTGKTTLLKAIAGEIAPEGGRIVLPRNVRIGRLAQEAPEGPQRLIDLVLAADVERSKLLAAAEDESEAGRIAEIHARLQDIGAHAAPARAAAILAGLGFSAEDQQRPCGSFSGGWRMRVALAALLFSQPDLLLLDEPTNYLDLEGTLWLQAFLARYPHTVLIASHDRDLLDHAAQYILHLERGKLALYRGNYSAFARQRAEREARDAKRIRLQALARKRIEAFVSRFRAKASKARQAQSRLKLLEKLEPVSAVVADEVRPIGFPAPERRISPPIVVLEDVVAGYEVDRPVLRRVNLRIDDDDRIAILGANGNGKSTLARLIAGRLAPMSGRVVRAEKLTVAYFAQHQLEELAADETPYAHFRRRMPEAPEATVRARLGAIGFSGDAADTQVAALSGGEKARLLLGLATHEGPHLIILDEPTNHLDIDSRAALIEAINEYPGAVVLISHDRYLLDACVDRLWLVEKGTVAPFDGDLDAYRRRVLAVGDEKAEAGRSTRGLGDGGGSRAAARRAAAERRAQLAPLRGRIARAEAAVTHWTRELERLDATLAVPDLYSDPARATALARERAAAAAALARAEETWLALSSEYEAATRASG
jgi:ATP-binding cassette subfamily F protein 3